MTRRLDDLGAALLSAARLGPLSWHRDIARAAHAIAIHPGPVTVENMHNVPRCSPIAARLVKEMYDPDGRRTASTYMTYDEVDRHVEHVRGIARTVHPKFTCSAVGGHRRGAPAHFGPLRILMTVADDSLASNVATSSSTLRPHINVPLKWWIGGRGPDRHLHSQTQGENDGGVREETAPAECDDDVTLMNVETANASPRSPSSVELPDLPLLFLKVVRSLQLTGYATCWGRHRLVEGLPPSIVGMKVYARLTTPTPRATSAAAVAPALGPPPSSPTPAAAGWLTKLDGTPLSAAESNTASDAMVPRRDASTTISSHAKSTWKAASVGEESARMGLDEHRRLIYLLWADYEQYYPVLLVHTGPTAYVADLRERAARRGLSLSVQGLFRYSSASTSPDGEAVHCDSELDVCHQLGVPYHAPWLR